MSFSRPIRIQWNHSQAGLMWPDGTFKTASFRAKSVQIVDCQNRRNAPCHAEIPPPQSVWL